MTKYVCIHCGFIFESPLACRVMHTVGDNPSKDTTGHHIAIQADRKWCAAEFVPYVDLRCSAWLMEGRAVGYRDFVLEDGRVLRHQRGPRPEHNKVFFMETSP